MIFGLFNYKVKNFLQILVLTIQLSYSKNKFIEYKFSDKKIFLIQNSFSEYLTKNISALNKFNLISLKSLSTQ
jgi:hypothetical protein